MKLLLRDYLENIPSNISWKKVLLLLIIIQINSFVLVNFFIPSLFSEEIRIWTGGIITPGQVAFLYSILFYSALFKLFGVSVLNSNIYRNNLNAVIVILTATVCIFLLLLPQYVHTTQGDVLILFGHFLELLFGAVFEELVFRFFLLAAFIQLFKKSFGSGSVWLSIIISSFIFSFGHIFDHIRQGQVYIEFYIWAFSIGILLSWIYILFNNIVLVILLHLFLNLIVLFLPLVQQGVILAEFIWYLVAFSLVIFGNRIIKITRANN
ncbi:CPBP family glutamic-type intramembrane protease [Pontibacter virosus]|uniref:CAAX prenyl protease-like protein n=1 Tax=Pontibacter virosus TaxID=1765052 RepID=A0A2U1AHZ3_9BACT|nr:CPBP family glutamic-type intramembrane protease [Pontibacter virosus]PVY36032.1 CAAX prenyl protease-like protein [Pontibacter virosus]